MPDTPNMLRGEFYPTHIVERCPNFKTCPNCGMCETYNRHRHDCQICEARKRPKRLCECKPATKLHARRIIELLGAPIIHQHHMGRGGVNSVDVADVADWEEMKNSLGLGPGPTRTG